LHQKHEKQTLKLQQEHQRATSDYDQRIS